MRTTAYPIIAEWDEAVRAWSILSPDFPEIASVAREGDDIGQQALDALLTAIEGRREDEEPIPAATQDAAALAVEWPRATRNMLLYVVVPSFSAPVRPVRVNVSIDQALLSRIDGEASRLGMTRSAFLSESARARLPD